MATPIEKRNGNTFLFVAYALIALSLWMVDREICGQSSQPSVIYNSDTADGASPQSEIYPSFVLPHNDKLYRPANSVLEQLAANESSSAEKNQEDDDNRHRAALALMVYLSTDGIKR
jgi:hypothetical protein